jgi:hypothetical protein
MVNASQELTFGTGLTIAPTIFLFLFLVLFTRQTAWSMTVFKTK